MTSEGYFRMQLILFAGMLMSQVTLVGTFIYLAIMGELAVSPDLWTTMIYVVPAMGTACFGISFLLPTRLIAKSADKATLSEKLRGYQIASILRMALLEAPALLGCIAFYLTGEYYFLVVNLISLGLFAMAFPSKTKLIEALRLSSTEVDQINDPQAIVMVYEAIDP